MKNDDQSIDQTPPQAMSTEERLDEVAMYLARAVARLKVKKDTDEIKGSLREYLKQKP